MTLQLGAVAVTLLVVAAAAPATPGNVCYCPNWGLSNFNCSEGCCSLPGAITCHYPPEPNPATAMSDVPIGGAVEMGALTPSGGQPFITLNLTGSRGWVVHMSGGGWNFMTNKTTAFESPLSNDSSSTLLQSRARGKAAGSAVQFTADGVVTEPYPAKPNASGCYIFCDGILSDDPGQNPSFYTFNKAFLPINDRTSFTGDRWDPVPTGTGGHTYVRGARILTAAIEFLLHELNMANATDVILTGGSSGGMAVFLNCDRVAAMIGAVNPDVRVTCLADAGFFLDHPTMSGVENPQFMQSFYGWNSSAATNQDCIAHYGPLGEPWKCIFSENVLPFVKTPLFVAQNLYDSYQLGNILRVGCGTYGSTMKDCNATQMAAVQAYGASMRTLLAEAAHPDRHDRGIFAPSCIAHCQTVANEHPAALWNWQERWSIGNVTPVQAFGAWYSGGDMRLAKVMEACDFGCNGKCPLFT